MRDHEKIAQKIKEADAILIGASNGLSITEGLHLFANNEAFQTLFGDFQKKYGIRSILQGMGARWPSEEEKWGFWSRLIHHYSGNYKPTQAMMDLKEIVGDKDYFIITTNGECHFEMSGFEKSKIFEMEGNWLTMQCAKPCHDEIYPSFALTEKMAAAEKEGKIPKEMIPHCPRCGGAMEIHMETGPNFIPDRESQKNLHHFLEKYHGKNLVILELGIGPRNQLIKAPLMQLTAQEPNATYVTINLGELYIPRVIANKTIGIDGYISEELCSIGKALL